MNDLTKDQLSFYQTTRDHCRQEVVQMNDTILTEWLLLNDEIRRVQSLIQVLEGRKQAVGSMFSAASELLGTTNDLDLSPAIKEGD